jgi:hypothetical protein
MRRLRCAASLALHVGLSERLCASLYLTPVMAVEYVFSSSLRTF